MKTVKNEKQKAANLLFEEIEHDVNDKEKFVVDQLERLLEMNQNYMTLLDYEQVLTSVQDNMKKMRGGAQIRGSMAGEAHFMDEETKQYDGSINQNRANRDDQVPLMEDG